MVSLEALRQSAAEVGQHLRILVDEDDLGLAHPQLLRDRVTVLPQEIEHVEPAEAEVPARRAEVPDLSLVCPVVDRLQIYLAEARDVARREELGLGVGVGDFSFFHHGDLLTET